LTSSTTVARSVDNVNLVIVGPIQASTTSDLLLDAAERLLDQGGIEQVTLREVGRGAGVSHNAPYKHFADKAALLGTLAARELRRREAWMNEQPDRPAGDRLRDAMHRYVDWAVEYPRRFKLIYGPWSAGVTDELIDAAEATHGQIVGLVVEAQAEGSLPAGDPERVEALVRALAHGAADLTLAGHLSAEGKGHATAHDLLDDLFAHLAVAAPAGR
jgi:AcrR family transcriptional regulator